MRYPSIKTLTEYFDSEKAVKIRAIMTGPVRVDGASQLQRLDTVLGNYGVERIPQGRNAKSPAIEYSNTGDSYGTTVMIIRGKFVIGNWGSIVEMGEYE